jgi:hypothetical protein
MRGVRIVIVLAGACAAAALAAGAVSGAAPAPLQRVTVFGDSQLTAVGYTPDAREKLGSGIDLDLRAAVCRRLVQESCPYQGVRPQTVLDEVKDAARPLGSVVVVLVGYNDYEGQYGDDVRTVARALAARDVKRVLWLTLTEERTSWARMNDELRAAAKALPQVEVLEWKQAADPSWFAGGDIHLTYPGAVGLATFIHAALLERGIAVTVPVAKPTPPKVSLRITVRGTGSVSLKGTRCRTSCSRLLPAGSVVRLTAQARAGAVFDRWSGACAGRRTACSLTLSRGRSVVARFRPAPR